MLVYKSEDIKDVSRLQSPKVCGYVKADSEELLPKGLIDREPSEGKTSCFKYNISISQWFPTVIF